MRQRETMGTRRGSWAAFGVYMRKYWVFYLFLLPALLDILVFRYGPMYGLIIAFKNFKINSGIWGSSWVGLKYFRKFLESPNFWQLMRNTFLISLYSLVFSFPAPIVLALMINEIRGTRYKKIVQTITYAPHFISTVAVIGLLRLFFERETGLFNLARGALGLEKLSVLTMPGAFRTLYVGSGVWQSTGWGSIIYLAALAGVDVETIEAAKVDGASRLQKIIHIDLPAILPTMVILLIMQCGKIFSVGYEKILLMQNSLILDVSDVISTYTYRIGILGGQFSYTTAIGLFNSAVNAVLLVAVNAVARKTSEVSLW